MSKADVNKIVELILSDDDTNQELGMMMAVSQGVKDDVLFLLHDLIKHEITYLVGEPIVDFECYTLLFSGFSNEKCYTVEAWSDISYAPHIMHNKNVLNKASVYMNLKNYNHEPK